MPRKQPSSETVGSVFEFLFQTNDISPITLSWPPDAFCFAASVLQRSAAYTHFVGDHKPAIHFKHPKKDRAEALEEIGEQWRVAAGNDDLPPRHVKQWIAYIKMHCGVSLEALPSHKRLLSALLNLMAAADESCFSLGISLTGADNDDFTKKAEIQLFPREAGSTLCKRVHPSRARVLPKSHTPQTGLTIRSFSNFLGLVPSSEVCPDWYSFCADTNEHALNLLLVPWPSRVIPKQFRATDKEKISDEVDRGGYGLFTFDVLEMPKVELVRRLLKSAEKTVGRIDGVIFPELSITPGYLNRLSRALVRDNRFLIGGVGKAASKGKCGDNYICFDLMLPGSEYVVRLQQSKHHRWKLEKNQIMQYGIGSTLHPGANWWEHISIRDRRLMLVTLRPWLTLSVLICEDLARPDPLGDVIRSVGPNLVICLLMDGPQISDRWPGRHATTLADDPGCSVLTLTSMGMAGMSKAPAGVRDRSDCIALWKDLRSGASKEIILPHGAAGLVLNIAVEYCEEWTADGRGDGQNAGHPYLTGQHPIYLRKKGV